MKSVSVPDWISSASPERIALIHGQRSVSYAELNDRANQVAAHLRERGVEQGDTVAVCLPRSPEWVIAALGIMRAGGAYVPVDLGWPDERLNYVLRDAGVSHIFAKPCTAERIKLNARVTDLAPDLRSDADSSAGALHANDVIAPDSLAYVIYTSGSTGVPKGVEITHGNLSHLVAWHWQAFKISADDRASHLAGLSFDAAGWEIWPYLAAGGTVIIADEMERTSPELLQRWMLAKGITVGFIPTVLAQKMCELVWPADTSLRFLLTGGDVLHRRPPAGLPFAVVNNYGPTECTVVATSGLVEADALSTPRIGRAITGAAVYILDERGDQAAAGSVGEIYVGGAGVGRGYRNLPELSAANFLKDPFAGEPDARMYRTGDRGLLRPDGEIEFRGRADTQEKIRGQRVELDEISSVLNRHLGVQAGVVATVINDLDEKYLVAYVVPAQGANLTSTELQQFLALSLPAFMIPTLFVRLQTIPLTLNGKINRRGLPPVDESELLRTSHGRTALSPLETKLLGMVRELLATDQVGVEDDFFLAGGHSLLGTQLVLRIRSMFAIDLSLRHLFEASSVERLARKVEELMIAQLEVMTDEEALQQMEVSA